MDGMLLILTNHQRWCHFGAWATFFFGHKLGTEYRESYRQWFPYMFFMFFLELSWHWHWFWFHRPHTHTHSHTLEHFHVQASSACVSCCCGCRWWLCASYLPAPSRPTHCPLIPRRGARHVLCTCICGRVCVCVCGREAAIFTVTF